MSAQYLNSGQNIKKKHFMLHVGIYNFAAFYVPSLNLLPLLQARAESFNRAKICRNILNPATRHIVFPNIPFIESPDAICLSGRIWLCLQTNTYATAQTLPMQLLKSVSTRGSSKNKGKSKAAQNNLFKDFSVFN